MGDVHVGDGDLAGRGVHAGRAFAAGETVLSYRLRHLTRDEYLALPEEERLFVHSYGGERWLYPAPARYVNHADAPNTIQDFDRGCAVAGRAIAAGEPITTDARRETARELDTFLAALHAAAAGDDDGRLDALVAADAHGWVGGLGAVDRHGLIGAAHGLAGDGPPEARWIVATGRWEAIGAYDVTVASSAGPPTVGHVTDVVRVVDGTWQLAYRHAST